MPVRRLLAFTDSLAIPHDQLVFLSSLYGSVIFGAIYFAFLFRLKGHSTVKHLYFFLAGNVLLWMNYSPSAMANIYVPIVMGFIITRTVRTKNVGLVNCIANFAHLALVQYSRYMGHQFILVDYTNVLMVATIKVTSFGFDLGNGKFSDKKSAPGALEYFSYCFMFPGVMVGPCMFFEDYRHFIDGSYERRVRRSDPQFNGRFVRMMYQLYASVFWLFVHAAGRNFFSTDLADSAECLSWNVFLRLAYVYCSLMVDKSKFYFVWAVSDAAYLASGAGFHLHGSGKENEVVMWDAMSNVDPMAIEMAWNFKIIVSVWNRATNRWLHTYFYTPLLKAGYGRSGSIPSLMTYLVSAFWHGFYPAYYLTFLSAAWLTSVNRWMYKRLTWPFGERSKKIAGWILLQLVMTYALTPIVLRDFSRVFVFYRSFYFYGHILLFLATIYLKVII